MGRSTRPVSCAAASHPVDPNVGCEAEAVGKLSGVMLDMPKVHQLVLEFGHTVPRESTLGTFEIQLVDGAVDHPVTELPIRAHLCLCILLREERKCAAGIGRSRGDTVGMLDFALVMLP